MSALTRLEPHVLRYWETEFPMLHPVKTPAGQRHYRRADVETVLAIKQLLYDEGFTIAGARKRLTSAKISARAATPAPSRNGNDAANRNGAATQAALREVRDELQRMLTLLSPRC